MRLVVSTYEADEQHSLDCALCPDDQQQHFTVTTWYDEVTHNTITVCPEHLDMMVTCALERHKSAMSGKDPDPFWYLEEDPDPWD